MSNEPIIEQMNEAIALFDGWEIREDVPLSDRPKLYVKDKAYRLVCELKYHLSWDWLMPVGKRIRDLLSDMLSKRPPHTACMGDVIEVDITCALHEYDIKKVHESIYVFIQWFNKTKGGKQ